VLLEQNHVSHLQFDTTLLELLSEVTYPHFTVNNMKILIIIF